MHHLNGVNERFVKHFQLQRSILHASRLLVYKEVFTRIVTGQLCYYFEGCGRVDKFGVKANDRKGVFFGMAGDTTVSLV